MLVFIQKFKPIHSALPFRLFPSHLVFHVNGVRLCLRPAASNGPTVHPQMIHEYAELWWNYPSIQLRYSPNRALASCIEVP
jgi:hypothetical protein